MKYFYLFSNYINTLNSVTFFKNFSLQCLLLKTEKPGYSIRINRWNRFFENNLSWKPGIRLTQKFMFTGYPVLVLIILVCQPAFTDKSLDNFNLSSCQTTRGERLPFPLLTQVQSTAVVDHLRSIWHQQSVKMFVETPISKKENSKNECNFHFINKIENLYEFAKD